MVYFHTSLATEVCGNEDWNSRAAVSVHKSRRRHAVKSNYRFKGGYAMLHWQLWSYITIGFGSSLGFDYMLWYRSTASRVDILHYSAYFDILFKQCCNYYFCEILSSHSGAAWNSILLGCNAHWRVLPDFGFSITSHRTASPSCTFSQPPTLVMLLHTICLFVINGNNQR
jgi:hypothetical protein